VTGLALRGLSVGLGLRKLPRMRFMLIASMAVLGACAATSVPGPTHRTVSSGTDFALKPGESVALDGQSLVLRFDSVVQDARCPRDVLCITEGNARIAVFAGETRLELNTSALYATEARAGAHVVKLRHLEPLPMAGVQTRDYTATLAVEAKN
jgi:hypothetical protein